jgi:predicted transcriptional regulator
MGIMTDKEKAIAALESLPSNLTFDDYVKELAFVSMIDRGIDDAKNGRHISADEMKRKVLSWH